MDNGIFLPYFHYFFHTCEMFLYLMKAGVFGTHMNAVWLHKLDSFFFPFVFFQVFPTSRCINRRGGFIGAPIFSLSLEKHTENRRWNKSVVL